MEKQIWQESDSKLLKQFRELYHELQKRMKDKWNRDLPIEELMFDRWERARQLGFGKGTSIYHNSYVYSGVKVGKNTWIGMNVVLDGEGKLEIGDNCSISAGVHIYTHDSVKWAISGGKEKYEYAPVKIGSCCYIGAQTIIAKGVKIGNHSVIGANSFVNKNILPYSIVARTPCKVIGRVKIDKNGNVKYEYFR